MLQFINVMLESKIMTRRYGCHLLRKLKNLFRSKFCCFVKQDSTLRFPYAPQDQSVAISSTGTGTTPLTVISMSEVLL